MKMLAPLLALTVALQARAALLVASRLRSNLGADAQLMRNVTANHTNQTAVTETNQTSTAFNPAFATYAACFINPNACQVNSWKVAAELGNRVLLMFGCSLDIYAVDYFCKAANAPVTGFSRAPGNTVYADGNFAYCKIGEFVLAYSFHPGASGPPYYPGCDDVLHKPCSQVNSAGLIQQSIAKVVATFGRPPTAIVLDSSLWDAAAWWIQDGKPPEPYVAPPVRVNKWCSVDLPNLLTAVQFASSTSVVAFRTAPRVEFMEGYGHSMQNIEAMNACFRGQVQGLYKLIDYNAIVEMLLARQGGVASTYFEDAFHPGVLPSVLYIDWVLQWVKTLPAPMTR